MPTLNLGRKFVIAILAGLGSALAQTFPGNETLIDNLVSLACIYIVGESVVDTAKAIQTKRNGSNNVHEPKPPDKS